MDYKCAQMLLPVGLCTDQTDNSQSHNWIG